MCCVGRRHRESRVSGPYDCRNSDALLAVGRHHPPIRSANPPRRSAADAGSGIAGALRVPLPETVYPVVPPIAEPETRPVAPVNSFVPLVKVRV